MAIDEKLDENFQFDINWAVAETSAIPAGKPNRYKYVTDEEVCPSKQHRIKKEVKLTYTLLRNALENKQAQLKSMMKSKTSIKSFKYLDREQLPIINFISERILNPEIMNELENDNTVSPNTESFLVRIFL